MLADSCQRLVNWNIDINIDCKNVHCRIHFRVLQCCMLWVPGTPSRQRCFVLCDSLDGIKTTGHFRSCNRHLTIAEYKYTGCRTAKTKLNSSLFLKLFLFNVMLPCVSQTAFPPAALSGCSPVELLFKLLKWLDVGGSWDDQGLQSGVTFGCVLVLHVQKAKWEWGHRG